MARTATLPRQRSAERSLKDVYVAWEYRQDPEEGGVRQFLGVFSSPKLAHEKTARMHDSGWTVQVVQARLDPDEVC
jgi:hypothetical protein